MTDEPLLRISDLSVAFHVEGRKTTALEDMNFTLEKGKTLALVGESGSGKSVTAPVRLRAPWRS